MEKNSLSDGKDFPEEMLFKKEYHCSVTEPKCSFHCMIERQERQLDPCHTKSEHLHGDVATEYRVAEDGTKLKTEMSICKVTRFNVTNGNRREEWTKSACVTDNVTEWATCTQYAHGVCLKCGNDNPLNPENYGSPMNHSFEPNESGNGYICSRCGLENENGQSGSIVLEDLSDESRYVAGYWNKENLVYEIFVFLVIGEESRMTDLEAMDNSTPFDSSTAYITKAEVQEWVKTNQVTEAYDVMFSFIPKNANVDTTYNIVFTEK